MMFLSVERVMDAVKRLTDAPSNSAEPRGPSGLQKLLAAADQPVPQIHTIMQWQYRRQIPGWWTGAVMYALARRGVHPLNLLIELPEAAVRPELIDETKEQDLVEQAEAFIRGDVSYSDTNETDGAAR